MLKVAGYALLWLIGSTVAVAVAWTGVAVVDDDIIPASALPEVVTNGPQLESAAQRNDQPRVTPTQASDSSTSATTNASQTDPSQTSTSAATSSNTTPTTSRPATTASSAPQATTGAPAAASASTTTPPTASTSTSATAATTSATTSTTTSTTGASTTSTSTTTTTTTTAVPSETKTFNLVGGSTSISFAPGAVKILWATPKPGFEVKVGSSGPDVRVEFESDDQESRIDAWWDNGPATEIRER